MAQKDVKTIILEAFKGLDNRNKPENTNKAYFKVAENVDIDNEGKVHKRSGYVRKISGSFHSLWSNGIDSYCVKDGSLVKLLTDEEYSVLVTDIGDTSVSFEEVDGVVYFSNPNINGAIEAGVVRSWGLSWPSPTPTLSNGVGVLTPGQYQVAITFVSTAGRESGSGPARTIKATSGGIQLSGIPTSDNPSVKSVRIYCSTPDGEVLYLVGEVPNGTASYLISDLYPAVTPLNTFNIFPAPKGSLIRYFSGRMYVVNKNVLWFSEPFAYEQFNFQKGFYQFPDEELIVSLIPVENGLWIGTTVGVYWIPGRNTSEEKIRLDFKEPIKIVPGTETKIVGAYLFLQNTPLGYKWLATTDKGIYAFYNDGMLINLTYRNVNLPASEAGAAAFIEEEGITKYLSTLRKPTDQNNARASDLVTATVIRNGIVIPP